jgi:hypothetical protein
VLKYLTKGVRGNSPSDVPLPKGAIAHTHGLTPTVLPHTGSSRVHIPPIRTWKINKKCGKGYREIANYAINAIGRPMLPDARFSAHNSPPTNTAVRSLTFPPMGRSSATSSAAPVSSQNQISRTLSRLNGNSPSSQRLKGLVLLGCAVRPQLVRCTFHPLPQVSLLQWLVIFIWCYTTIDVRMCSGDMKVIMKPVN